MPTIVCPLDNKDDAVQKVSAVVAGGISTGSFSGLTGGFANVDGKRGDFSGYTSLSGNTISNLARALKPPDEPKLPFGYGWTKWGCAILSGIFLLWFGCGGLLFSLLFAFGSINEQPSNPANGIVILIYSVFISIFFALIGFVSYKSSDSKDKRDKAHFSSAKPQWQKAIERWNRLYYCHKHGVVFDHDTGEYCEPVHFIDFLYQESKP